MSINVDKKEAEKVLLSAFSYRCVKSDDICRKIRKVITGNHKTYRYILVTGLLAKATNEKVNALSLQAQAPFEGAFDARTICHQVLVPFERNFLHNALGGSNEPFLNKPARFTHLDGSNAVRRGNDKDLLDTLIFIFKSINTSIDAKEYLSCALAMLSDKVEEQSKLNDSQISYNPTLVEVYEFILILIGKSFEGETSVIVVGALEKIFYEKLGEDFEVVIHKVNQSGASSKEIGDIDIFKCGKYQYSIEVKDKNFSVHDVEHAFLKMKQANGDKGEFIFGPHASFDKDLILIKLKNFEEEGFYTLFHDLRTYSKQTLLKTDLQSKSEFVKAIFEAAKEINSKDETKEWIQETLEHLKWK